MCVAELSSRRCARFFKKRYSSRMPKPPQPDDLTWCLRCRKVIGPHKGWFGPECQCGRPIGDALRGAHGTGTGRR